MIAETLEEVLENDSSADAGEMTSIEREHYDEIVELNKQVAIAERDYLYSKSQTKAAKEELESLQSRLTYVISRGPEVPNPQQSLPFPEDAPADAWRDEPITDAIKITPKQFERLEDAGARTMGQLEDLRAGKFPTHPDGLRSIKGFGDKAIDTIEDQILEWWDKNKNAREPEVAEESEEDAE